MKRKTGFTILAALLAVAALTLAAGGVAWAHGEETSIVPASLNAKAGGELKVRVNGLSGAKEASFALEGMFGKRELGKLAVKSDDFDTVLKIPADVQPGAYKLTVSGGAKSASVVININ